MLNKYNREGGTIGQTLEERVGGCVGGGGGGVGEGGGGRGGGGRENENVRRERKMESARGSVHLTSGRARVHTRQSCFCFFLCRYQY